MFLWNWFWCPDPSPARNMPDNLTIKTCPVVLTQQQVVTQLAGLRKRPPPQPRTSFEPSELQAQLTRKYHEMQMKMISRSSPSLNTINA